MGYVHFDFSARRPRAKSNDRWGKPLAYSTIGVMVAVIWGGIGYAAWPAFRGAVNEVVGTAFSGKENHPAMAIRQLSGPDLR